MGVKAASVHSTFMWAWDLQQTTTASPLPALRGPWALRSLQPGRQVSAPRCALGTQQRPVGTCVRERQPADVSVKWPFTRSLRLVPQTFSVRWMSQLPGSTTFLGGGWRRRREGGARGVGGEEEPWPRAGVVGEARPAAPRRVPRGERTGGRAGGAQALGAPRRALPAGRALGQVRRPLPRWPRGRGHL